MSEIICIEHSVSYFMLLKLIMFFFSLYYRQYRVIHKGSYKCHVGLPDPRNTCFTFSLITTVVFILVVFLK